MKEDRDSVRRLKGDGLFVQMDSNNCILEVTGDGCKITLMKNYGSIRVMGDGCLIKVMQNLGDIVYTGDGGKVLLGPESSIDNIQYFGVGGKISFGSESMEKINSNERNNVKESINTLNNYLGMDKVKKTIKKTKIINNFDSSNDTKETKKSCIKNCDLRNDMKEKNNSKIQDNDKDMKNVKPNTTVFVTTTTTTTTKTTTSNKSGNLFQVNKWFVSPTSVVQNLVENVPTVTVYKKKSMKNSTKK